MADQDPDADRDVEQGRQPGGGRRSLGAGHPGAHHAVHQAEAKLFTECLFSDQSKALIHVFFGEREVAKYSHIPKEIPVIPVNRVAIVGSGTMGGGIAMVFANAGIPVLLKDVDEAALNLGMEKIRRNYASSVQRGRFTQAFVVRRLQLITPVFNYEAFSGATRSAAGRAPAGSWRTAGPIRLAPRGRAGPAP